MIKVFGHKAPDTDATASAIIWAWYMKKKGIKCYSLCIGQTKYRSSICYELLGF